MNVVCVGDCGVDRYVNRGTDRPGGITLNFAVTAKRLFPRTDRISILTVLGRDREAETVKDAISHFSLDSLITDAAGATPVQYIDQEPTGERRFVRYEEGVLAGYRMGAPERVMIAASDLLVAPVFGQIVGLFDSVMEAPSRGLRAVDFSDLADFGSSADFLGRYLPRFDVGFFGLRPDQHRLIADLEHIARQAAKLLIVTLGPAGSLALGTSTSIACPALPVEPVVDTTGAGDTFAAGFLSEYCYSRDVMRSLEEGHRQAALSIQRVGVF